jgi:hypothetical protein
VSTRTAAALPIVLLAITLVSALAVGGVFLTRQLASSVRVSQRAEELEPETERALVQAIVAWDSVARAQQPIGTSVPIAVAPSTSTRVDAWVTRLSDKTYWLVARAVADVRPVLRRRIGVLVRVSGDAPALVPERAWGDLP